MALSEVSVAHPGVPPFEDAYPRLYQDAYRVAYRLLGDRTEAEDVAQEACARAYSRWRGVHEYAEPWCVRVAGNLALDALRAKSRSVKRQERLAREPERPGDTGVDVRLDLHAALASLSRR